MYRLTDDGKTCIDLPAECVDYVFDFCDDAALYGVKTSGTNGQNTKAVRVDLTTGELQSVPLEPTEYFVTCYDGALLTVRYVTDAPLPDDFEQFRAAVQSATVEFDRYDPRTGERRKLIERPYNIADERLSGYLGTHNGKLYFEEREALQDGGYNRGALQEYDPADGSTATVWDAPPPCSLWDYQDTYTNVLPARGSRAEDWLWLYGTDGAVGGNRCYLMNAAARELVPITQRMKNYAYDIPPSLLAQTADGRWLFWTESNDENAHLAYGLIAPNDFAAGSTDYTPVEMRGRLPLPPIPGQAVGGGVPDAPETFRQRPSPGQSPAEGSRPLPTDRTIDGCSRQPPGRACPAPTARRPGNGCPRKPHSILISPSVGRGAPPRRDLPPPPTPREG